MFWILQDNLYDEKAFVELLDQLKRQNTKYEVVKVIPFIAEMVPNVEVPPGDRVMVIGATSMSKIAKRKGWVPGYFDDNLDYKNLLHNYGDYMLNAGCVIRQFDKLEKVWDQFHIRPSLDSKSFSGQIMTWEEFDEWRAKVIAIGDDENSMTTLTAKDEVVMSALMRIQAEYRFFVVDGKVVTGSLYKHGSRILYSDNVDAVVSEFAQKMVDLWAPNRAFALDVADTIDGLKVIEINSINSSGFYACNMGKFVNAINSMEF